EGYMRSFLFTGLVASAVLAAALSAQAPQQPAPQPQATQTPQQPAPKPSTLAPGATVQPGTLAPGTPATPAPVKDTPPDTIVAHIDGKDYTAAEIKKIGESLPSPMQRNWTMDATRTLNYVFMMRYFAQQGELHNLDKDPQFQQQLQFTKEQ